MKMAALAAGLVVATGLAARGEDPLPAPGPGEAGVLSPQRDGFVAVVAADKGSWDRYKAGQGVALLRERRLDYVPAGTAVVVVKVGVADGAIEVLFTTGPGKGRVGWVLGSTVVALAGDEEIKARRPQMSEERRRDLEREVARRAAQRKAMAEAREAERIAAAEAKMAPIWAQQQREAARLQLEATNAQAIRDMAKAARQNADSYRRDVNVRAIWGYGVPATVDDQGRMVPYGYD
jgi:hypothetical protein